MAKCFLYAIGIEGGDWGGMEFALKIGVALDPKARMASLQVGSPARLAMRRTWEFPSEFEARQAEAACHKEFAKQCSKGEWFFVKHDDVDSFLREAAQMKIDDEARREAEELAGAVNRSRRVDNGLLRSQPRPSPVPMIETGDDDALLTTDQAARLLGKSPSWLNKTRMNGSGPVYFKIGGAVRYKVDDLNRWLDSAKRVAVYAHANAMPY